MVDFAAMKKNSGKTALESLTQELQKISGNQESGADTRFWYPNVDKAGNGYAVIRFLPAPGEETVPFVRVFEHGFKGPTGQWYIEKSLSTIGQPDPLGVYNSKLWNSTTDDASPARKQARDQKRKLTYISNVYIINDQANPENNGKVFLFKFGKKIWDKINEAMHPQFADEKAINPFDFWEGADFKLKIRNVEGYRNYDKSEFSAPSPLFDDDSKLEKVWKQEHSLQAFIDPKNFKSYDELEKRLNLVLGLNGSQAGRPRQAEVVNDLDDEIPWNEPKSQKVMQSKPIASASSLDDDDEDMAFFRKLSS
jgi:hypothetical protein